MGPDSSEICPDSPDLPGHSGITSGYSGPSGWASINTRHCTLFSLISFFLLQLWTCRAELCSPPTAPRPSPAAVRRSLLREPSQPRPAPPPHLHEPRSSFARQESTALSPTAMGVPPELRPFALIRFSGSPPPKSIMGMDSW